MKKCTETQSSPVHWLGIIPVHWEISKIKRKCYLIGSGSTPQSNNEKYYNGGINWIQSGDLYNRDRIHATLKTVSDVAICECSALSLYKAPFVVIAMYGASIGNVSISDIDSCVNQACCVLVPNDSLGIKFLFYWAKACKDNFIRQSIGGTQPNISQQKIKDQIILVPPLVEQDQIVRFLDWKISMANHLINTRRQEIKAIDAMKRSVVNSAVTRGLNPDAPMKYSGVKWLGDIPAHWETVKLRRLLHPVSVKNHPELPLLSVVREQGVIVRDIADKEANHNYIPDDLSGYKMVKKGQFAMNKMKAWQGSYGISDYTGIVSPAYFIFDVSFDNLEYFHYAVRSKVYVNFFAQASDGIRVGQWDLQMDKMKEIPFIVPPPDEQVAIVEHIKRMLPKYDVAIEKLSEEVAVLEEYKAKLIVDVVTGKMDVRSIEIPDYKYMEEETDGTVGVDGEKAVKESEDL